MMHDAWCMMYDDNIALLPYLSVWLVECVWFDQMTLHGMWQFKNTGYVKRRWSLDKNCSFPHIGHWYCTWSMRYEGCMMMLLWCYACECGLWRGFEDVGVYMYRLYCNKCRERSAEATAATWLCSPRGLVVWFSLWVGEVPGSNPGADLLPYFCTPTYPAHILVHTMIYTVPYHTWQSQIYTLLFLRIWPGWARKPCMALLWLNLNFEWAWLVSISSLHSLFCFHPQFKLQHSFSSHPFWYDR